MPFPAQNNSEKANDRKLENGPVIRIRHPLLDGYPFATLFIVASLCVDRSSVLPSAS